MERVDGEGFDGEKQRRKNILWEYVLVGIWEEEDGWVGEEKFDGKEHPSDSVVGANIY